MIFMVYYGAYLYYTMLYYLCYLMCVILYYAILWVKTYVFFLFLFLLMSFAAVHAWFQSLESQTKTSVVHPFQKVVYVHSNGVIHCTCMFYVLICTSILCSMKTLISSCGKHRTAINGLLEPQMFFLDASALSLRNSRWALCVRQLVLLHHGDE